MKKNNKSFILLTSIIFGTFNLCGGLKAFAQGDGPGEVSTAPQTQDNPHPEKAYLSSLPPELLQHIASFLPLADRFKLMHTSQTVFEKVIPFVLRQNIYRPSAETIRNYAHLLGDNYVETTQKVTVREFLSSIKKLRISHDRRNQFTTEELQRVISHCSQLESLDTNGDVVNDALLQSIGQRYTRLKALSLNTRSKPYITDDGIKALGGLELLESLELNEFCLNMDLFKQIGENLKRLRTLRFTPSLRSERGRLNFDTIRSRIDALEKLKLESLSLINLKANNVLLEVISKACEGLKELSLSGCLMPTANLSYHINKIKNLEKLDLSRAEFKAGSLSEISLPKLRELNLSGRTLSSNYVDRLKLNNPQLNLNSLGCTIVTRPPATPFSPTPAPEAPPLPGSV